KKISALGCDKESSKVEKSADMLTIHDDEEEEGSAGDEFELKRREKGKGIEETKDTPPPTPIRSPKTHIAPLYTDKETLQELTTTAQDAHSSLDKEKLKELMVIDPTSSSSTPSSSSPKSKTDRFRRYKSFIKQMGERYGYLFGHMKKSFMPKKSFHELSIALQSTLQEVLPSMVDKRVNEIAKTTVLDDEKLRNDDLSIWWSLKIKFEKSTPSATPCRTIVVRIRDHEDHHDDDARPEGESSTKRQKTFEHDTYSVGESLSGQVSWKKTRRNGA
ncbi:hypothetical protein Tco_0995394, partial [Tanacetum coccineum]